MAREIAQSWEGRVSRRLRKKIEMLFTHLKRILKLDRLRLRGPNGATSLSSQPPPRTFGRWQAGPDAHLQARIATDNRCSRHYSELLPAFFNGIGQ